MTVSREAAMRGYCFPWLPGLPPQPRGGSTVNFPVGWVLGPLGLFPSSYLPGLSPPGLCPGLLKGACAESLWDAAGLPDMSVFLSGVSTALVPGGSFSAALPHRSFIKACWALQSSCWTEKAAQSGLHITLQQNGWRPRQVSPTMGGEWSPLHFPLTV